MNKKRKICFPQNVGRLCGVSDFDLDDLGMNGCNGFMQFRILGFPHHFDGLFDPGQRLTLGAAVTTGGRNLNAPGGKSAGLVQLRNDGVVHDYTKRTGLFTKFLVGMAVFWQEICKNGRHTHKTGLGDVGQLILGLNPLLRMREKDNYINTFSLSRVIIGISA